MDTENMTAAEQEIESTATEQGAKSEKTFTQAELDTIIGDRLARAKKDMPSTDDLKAFKAWQKTQKTAEENALEQQRLLESAQNELKQYKAQNAVMSAECKKEFSEFVSAKIASMDGDFEANLAKYKKDNPQYFGETTVIKKSSAPNLSNGGAQTKTTNDLMNNLLRNRGVKE